MVTPNSPSDWANIAGQFRNTMRVDSFSATPTAANTRFGGAVIGIRGRIVAHRVATRVAPAAGVQDTAVAVNGTINSGAQATQAIAATSQDTLSLSIDVEPGDIITAQTGDNVDAATRDLVSSVEVLQRFL